VRPERGETGVQLLPGPDAPGRIPYHRHAERDVADPRQSGDEQRGSARQGSPVWFRAACPGR